MRDLHSNVSIVPALDASAISTDTTTAGEIIDRQDFGAVEFAIHSGTITDGEFVPKIEHGEDASLSDAAEVTASELLGTLAGATFASTDGDLVKRIGYVGGKRFVRLSLVSSDTDSGGAFSAVAVLAFPLVAPVP